VDRLCSSFFSQVSIDILPYDVKIIFTMKTTRETSDILGVGEPTVRRWLDRGLLQGTKSVGTGRGSCQIDEDSIERFLTAYPIYRVPAEDRLTLNEVCGVLGLARNQRGHAMLPQMGLPIFYGPEQELVRGYVSRTKLVELVESLTITLGKASKATALERLKLLRQPLRANVEVTWITSLGTKASTSFPLRPQMVLKVGAGEVVRLLDHVVCKRVEVKKGGELQRNGFQLRSLQ